MDPSFLARPAHAPRPSRRLLVRVWLCAFLAAIACMGVTLSEPPEEQDYTARNATSRMVDGLGMLARLRSASGIPLDSQLDPTGSGLIGVEDSDLTTTLGDLRAKQLSTRPEFAGLIVHWLRRAGVHPGDRVALTLTGSFPGLNLAAMSACAALQLQPIIISSVGSSSYGANIPGFTWLDMERHLYDRGVLPWRSGHVSLGGIIDTEGGLDGQGLDLGRRAIAAHGAAFLDEGGAPRVQVDIERRWKLYTAEGLPRAYINVGGAVTALGWVPEAALLGNGLIGRAPSVRSELRGLIFRMHEAGVPVIHLLNVERLAARHHVALSPSHVTESSTDRHATWKRHVLLLGAVLAVWSVVCSPHVATVLCRMRS